MELLVGICAIGVIGWIITKAARNYCESTPERWTPARPSAEEQRRIHEARRRLQVRHLNQKARAFQLALLQLSRAHDFRRAASFAAQAKAVPAAFRQRQFRRFRPLLVRHFISRLRAGAEATALLKSLRQLLACLAVPAYEADYIAADAQRRLLVFERTVTEPPPTYAQQLAQLQRDHAGRVQALRELSSVDRDMREQLLEAEQTRFRQALQDLSLTDANAATSA